LNPKRKQNQLKKPNHKVWYRNQKSKKSRKRKRRSKRKKLRRNNLNLRLQLLKRKVWVERARNNNNNNNESSLKYWLCLCRGEVKREEQIQRSNNNIQVYSLIILWFLEHCISSSLFYTIEGKIHIVGLNL
jgi:hypothetical protein